MPVHAVERTVSYGALRMTLLRSIIIPRPLVPDVYLPRYMHGVKYRTAS